MIKILHPPSCIVIFCSVCAYGILVSQISLRFVSNVIIVLTVFKLLHLSNNSFRLNFSKLGSRDHTA